MIARVFDNDDSMYYCTLCNRPMKELHQANEHAKFCGQAVPMPTPEHEAMSRASSLISRAKLTDKQRKERTEKYFPSPAKAATPDDDDDTQVYRKLWVALTDEDLDYLCHLAYTGDEEFALTVQAMLKKKNA